MKLSAPNQDVRKNTPDVFVCPSSVITGFFLVQVDIIYKQFLWVDKLNFLSVQATFKDSDDRYISRVHSNILGLVHNVRVYPTYSVLRIFAEYT